VETSFRRSLDEANRTGRGLRVRIRTDQASSLADIPWEYLFSASLDRFVALSRDTPLVRFVERADRVPPLAVDPPLRILAVVASPTDLVPLNVEREVEVIVEATSALVNDRRVAVVVERGGDLPSLQRRLRTGEFHIFHFVGHGGFDPALHDGVLFLVGADGKSRPVPARELGIMLHDHHTLRLAVLNACEGARTGIENPLGGVAQGLVRHGIPAAVAMQFEISDGAAIAFSGEFYRAIADGLPVDAATVEARKAILAEGSDVEWGTPVLYLRASDGAVFEIPEGPVVGEPDVDVPQPRPTVLWWLAAAAILISLVVTVLLLRDRVGDPATPTTIAAAPTTIPAAATTTPPAPTTTAVEEVEEFAVGVPSLQPPESTAENGASGSGCLPESGPVPDGIWFGKLVEKPRSDSMIIDAACFFFGEVAATAAAEDGAGEVNNDYYIRDNSVSSRTMVVSDRAVVYFVPGGDPSAGFEIVPYVSWPGSSAPIGCPGDFCLAWIYVNEGIVTEIAIQWVP
jgi:hypothetical protein